MYWNLSVEKFSIAIDCDDSFVHLIINLMPVGIRSPRTWVKFVWDPSHGAGNRIQILCKSSKYSQTLRHPSSSHFVCVWMDVLPGWMYVSYMSAWCPWSIPWTWSHRRLLVDMWVLEMNQDALNFWASYPPPPTFSRQSLIIKSWLAWNSLCRLGRPWTKKDPPS